MIEYSSHAPERLANAYPRLEPHLLLPDGTPDYLRLILNAKVYDLIRETPLVKATNLSNRFGNEIWLKREDLQEVFSFKIRGAYNFMANLREDERWRGVVTCSAGQYVIGCPARLTGSYPPRRKSCPGCGFIRRTSQYTMHDCYARGYTIYQSEERRTTGSEGGVTWGGFRRSQVGMRTTCGNP